MIAIIIVATFATGMLIFYLGYVMGRRHQIDLQRSERLRERENLRSFAERLERKVRTHTDPPSDSGT